MLPYRATLGAVGNSTWFPLNHLCDYFAVGFGVTLSSTGNLTYTVQHSFDDPNPTPDKACIVTRSTTTATLVFYTWGPNQGLVLREHGLTTSDSVIVKNTGSSVLDGQFNVASVVDVNTITYTVSNSGLTTSLEGALANPMRVFNHSAVAAKTTQQDGNYAYPIRAIRLNCSVWTAGKVSISAVQAGK